MEDAHLMEQGIYLLNKSNLNEETIQLVKTFWAAEFVNVSPVPIFTLLLKVEIPASDVLIPPWMVLIVACACFRCTSISDWLL